MPSFSRIAATSMLLIAAIVPFATARTQARPAAADVIAKYVAAIGGKSELMKLTSFKQTATVDVAAMGLSGNMEMQAAAPNKLLTKMTIPNMVEQQQGFDGAMAWEHSPQQGARLLADQELAEFKEEADFYGNLLYSADRYASMETVGDTSISGEKAYKLKLVSKMSGSESLQYFSASTGLLLLEVRKEGSQQVLEYKKFGPLMVPTKIVLQQGPMKLMVNVKEVLLNSVPESAFAAPDQVKRLIKP